EGIVIVEVPFPVMPLRIQAPFSRDTEAVASNLKDPHVIFSQSARTIRAPVIDGVFTGISRLLQGKHGINGPVPPSRRLRLWIHVDFSIC
ncbi:MAG: hypothetical protein ACAH83_01295, partial [Alphaproteobacteria bacterium]